MIRSQERYLLGARHPVLAARKHEMAVQRIQDEEFFETSHGEAYEGTEMCRIGR